MAKSRILGIDYAAKAGAVLDDWRRLANLGTDDERRLAGAKLRRLTTFELRARANPLNAGDAAAKDRWPGDLVRDSGADLSLTLRSSGSKRGYSRTPRR